MFESAEIGHRIDKATYREAVPTLRAALQQAQVALHGPAFSDHYGVFHPQ